MLYAITAILKDDAEAKLEGLAADFNEHLSQPFRKVRMAGALCGPEGRRAGYMALVEADSFEAARRYLDERPLTKAGLYTRADVLEYRVELGALAGD